MIKKLTVANIMSIVSIAVVAIGSGIGQWATMKEWKEGADKEAEEKKN